METSTSTIAQAKSRLALYCAGWTAFISSVLFTLLDRPIPYWCSLGILLLGSLVYGVGVSVSQQWRSKAVQSSFSPYLLGSAGWLMLYLFFWLLCLCFG